MSTTMKRYLVLSEDGQEEFATMEEARDFAEEMVVALRNSASLEGEWETWQEDVLVVEVKARWALATDADNPDYADMVEQDVTGGE